MTKKLLTILLASGFIAAGCSDGSDSEEAETAASPEEEVAEPDTVEESSGEDDFLRPFDGPLTHVHGMGYIEAERGLYFASHTGLKIYQDGGWFETARQFNDYMGFNAVDEGFYTSGHPGADSDLPNPIGIQRSNDGGRSLESLSFEGETDFHLMAAGYRSHDLFVMNPHENSEMTEGLYLSKNAGEEWEQLDPQGLEGELTALAIHPDDSRLMAVASVAGVFLSEDGGVTFERITEEGEFGTAVHFTENKLYYASHGVQAALQSYDLAEGAAKALELPELKEDGAIFIAVSPQDDNEISFYTVQGDVFRSNDGGLSWEQLLDNGKIQ